MNSRQMLAAVFLCTSAIILTRGAKADPCGMVPPIYPNGQLVPLTRIGEQKTYVFFKDGIETFVIRPGFTGKVEEFGMLIPFPTPPAIRKVPDHIFQHVAAAIDPPEVVVDLRYRLERDLERGRRFSANQNRAVDKLEILKKDQVRVLREEAVGMYEVAVLEAGSAKALKRWMDDHGYKYPDGMDRPCNEYVESGWCFVAVKTKVSHKDGVDPKPGLRKVDVGLPDGSAFNGYVQAMGFRFEVDDLVVPMRLSAFNGGDLRNIVYLLTDKPRKIRAIPEEYVVRQITGKDLIRNVTGPLPLRIIGGTADDIPDSQRKNLVTRRNPVPHNGAAKVLFASDLRAVSSGRLALPHEEQEKVLLRIGERFGLRGREIDRLNEQALADLRGKIAAESLDHLANMTLTVVDGDFPRQLLAKQNLTFAHYRMSARRNTPQSYDAKLNGPAPKTPGIRLLGQLETSGERHRQVEEPLISGNNAAVWLIAGFALTIGLVFAGRRKKQN